MIVKVRMSSGPAAEATGDDVAAGVDVGGRRKGFHVVKFAGRAVEGPTNLKSVDEVVEWLSVREPAVVGVDSPRAAAPPGERSRESERALASAVCGIRWTPDEEQLASNPYYDWVVAGLELYRRLEEEAPAWGGEVVEVFPTASWTVWAGRRGDRPRAEWTGAALAGFGLEGLPPRRLNQDDRDAIAAALTARLHARGATDRFGEIVVPNDLP